MFFPPRSIWFHTVRILALRRQRLVPFLPLDRGVQQSFVYNSFVTGEVTKILVCTNSHYLSVKSEGIFLANC